MFVEAPFCLSKSFTGCCLFALSFLLNSYILLTSPLPDLDVRTFLADPV